MGPGLTGWVKRFQCGGALSHALAGEREPVGVMDEAIKDGVGEGGVPDSLVPVLDRQLAGDDGGAAAVAVFEDFEQVAPLG